MTELEASEKMSQFLRLTFYKFFSPFIISKTVFP